MLPGNSETKLHSFSFYSFHLFYQHSTSWSSVPPNRESTSSADQSKGNHSASGKSWRYPAHGESGPKLLSYITATQRAISPASSVSSITWRAPEVFTVRQACFGMLATTSPSFKSQMALTAIPSSLSVNCRVSLYSMPFESIHRLNALNLLLLLHRQR